MDSGFPKVIGHFNFWPLPYDPVGPWRGAAWDELKEPGQLMAAMVEQGGARAGRPVPQTHCAVGAAARKPPVQQHRERPHYARVPREHGFAHARAHVPHAHAVVSTAAGELAAAQRREREDMARVPHQRGSHGARRRVADADDARAVAHCDALTAQ